MNPRKELIFSIIALILFFAIVLGLAWAVEMNQNDIWRTGRDYDEQYYKCVFSRIGKL